MQSDILKLGYIEICFALLFSLFLLVKFVLISLSHKVSPSPFSGLVAWTKSSIGFFGANQGYIISVYFLQEKIQIYLADPQYVSSSRRCWEFSPHSSLGMWHGSQFDSVHLLWLFSTILRRFLGFHVVQDLSWTHLPSFDLSWVGSSPAFCWF